MNLRSFTYAGRRRVAGLTLVEVMIASGLGLLQHALGQCFLLARG